MSHREMAAAAFRSAAINELPPNYPRGGNYPPGVNEIPLDDPCDDVTDAETILAKHFAWHNKLNALQRSRVRFGDECIGTVDGEWVEFEMPSVRVKVRRDDAVTMAADVLAGFVVATAGMEDVVSAATGDQI